MGRFPVLNSDDAKIVLPTEGVLDDEGYLFHHKVPKPLTSEMIARLHDHGIKYSKGERFSKTEDDRIRKNWKKFSSKHGFRYEDGLYYAGYIICVDGITINDVRKQNSLLMNLGIWRRLCRKLERRSAAQVQSRMFILFDPHFVGLPSPLTPDEVMVVVSMRNHGYAVIDIGMEISRPLNQVWSALHMFKQRANGATVEQVMDNPDLMFLPHLEKRHWRRLYMTVMRYHLVVCEKDIINIFIDKRNSGAALRLFDSFPWPSIISRFSYTNERTLRNTFSLLLSELCDAFLWRYDSEAYDDVTSWWDSVNEALPMIDRKLGVIRTYLKALKKSVPKTDYVLADRTLDKVAMGKRLYKHGLAPHLNVYDPKTCFLWKSVRKMFILRERQFFRNLQFPLLLKDKLRVFERCYKRLAIEAEEKGIVDDTHIGDDPKMSFPPVSRICFVECLIWEMLKIDPDWAVPTHLRKWIRDLSLVHRLSGVPAETVMDPESYLPFTRFFTFNDSRCKRSLSVFERALARELECAVQDKRSSRENNAEEIQGGSREDIQQHDEDRGGSWEANQNQDEDQEAVQVIDAVSEVQPDRKGKCVMDDADSYEEMSRQRKKTKKQVRICDNVPELFEPGCTSTQVMGSERTTANELVIRKRKSISSIEEGEEASVGSREKTFALPLDETILAGLGQQVFGKHSQGRANSDEDRSSEDLFRDFEEPSLESDPQQALSHLALVNSQQTTRRIDDESTAQDILSSIGWM